MKFTAPASELREFISKVGRFASSRSPIPILMHVRLTVSNGTLTAEACDAVSWVSSSIPVEAESEGVCTAHASDLEKFLGRCEDSVEILFDKFLFVKSGGNRFKMPTLDPEDFPNMPVVDGEPMDFSLDVLRAAFESVRHSLQPEGYKSFTMGYELANGDLLVAHSHHGAVAKVAGPEASVLLHSSAADWVTKAADGGTLTIKRSSQLVHLTDGKSEYVSSQLQAEFPPYRKGIASLGELDSFTVEKEPFVALVESALLLKPTRISVVLANGEAMVYASNDISSYAGSTPAEFGEIEDARFCINPGYFIAALKAAPGELLRIFFANNRHVRVEVDGRDDWLSMIQPLHWEELQGAA